MSGLPMFAWMFRDPADVVDQRRGMEDRIATMEQEQREFDRRRKARRIRAQVKLAKAGKLKGQKR